MNSDLTNRLVIAVVFCISFFFSVNAQQNITYGFNVVYIDNSKPTSNDGFTDDLREIVYKNLERLESDSLSFFVFYSNGEKFMIASDSQGIKPIKGAIYNQPTIFTNNQIYEVAKIKDELFDRIKEMRKNIVFDFFVSEKLVKQITGQPAYLFKLLPLEVLNQFEPNSITAKVNIHYPTANKVVNQKEAENVLNFYNNRAKSMIKYTLKVY